MKSSSPISDILLLFFSRRGLLNGFEKFKSLGSYCCFVFGGIMYGVLKSLPNFYFKKED